MQQTHILAPPGFYPYRNGFRVVFDDDNAQNRVTKINQAFNDTMQTHPFLKIKPGFHGRFPCLGAVVAQIVVGDLRFALQKGTHALQIQLGLGGQKRLQEGSYLRKETLDQLVAWRDDHVVVLKPCQIPDRSVAPARHQHFRLYPRQSDAIVHVRHALESHGLAGSVVTDNVVQAIVQDRQLVLQLPEAFHVVPILFVPDVAVAVANAVAATVVVAVRTIFGSIRVHVSSAFQIRDQKGRRGNRSLGCRWVVFVLVIVIVFALGQSGNQRPVDNSRLIELLQESAGGGRVGGVRSLSPIVDSIRRRGQGCVEIGDLAQLRHGSRQSIHVQEQGRESGSLRNLIGGVVLDLHLALAFVRHGGQSNLELRQFNVVLTTDFFRCFLEVVWLEYGEFR
mmetsp:Transcript_12151/g.28514  ORF Transcript_12151/g.28514 Transcript_12151/m.28514 type:complete len:394 (-) Transcript_12151:531-1712(-)